MAAAERQEAVRRFQTEGQVRAAVLSVTAAGQGITLTGANTVVFAELRATPGVNRRREEALRRAVCCLLRVKSRLGEEARCAVCEEAFCAVREALNDGAGGGRRDAAGGGPCSPNWSTRA
eukprot:550639-Rhodomonas_salina.1